MNLLRAASNFFGPLLAPFRKAPFSTAGFETRIHHRFKNRDLLAQALRHKSTVSCDDRKGLQSNERLEFLGDAVLSFLVTEYLYHVYPDKSEGDLSKIKSVVVSRKVLGEIATELGLEEHIVVDNDSGIGRGNSIASNALEALIGAVYLDAGIDVVRHFLRRHHFCRIDEFITDTDNTNYKSKILELSQRDGFGIPEYTVLSSTGPDHAKTFRVTVAVAGLSLGEGEGANKKAAQQNAAKEALSSYRKSRILSHIKGVPEHELLSLRRTADDRGNRAGNRSEKNPAGQGAL